MAAPFKRCSRWTLPSTVRSVRVPQCSSCSERGSSPRGCFPYSSQTTGLERLMSEEGAWDGSIYSIADTS
eukprot:1878826-Pyramimonas_sp.AAC.1